MTSRRSLIGGIGANMIGAGAYMGTVAGKNREQKNEGFGKPSYLPEEHVNASEQLQGLVSHARKSDVVVVTKENGHYVFRLSKRYFENKIEYSGSLSQEDFNDSEYKRNLERDHNQAKKKLEAEIQKKAFLHSTDVHSPDRTVHIGDDVSLDRRDLWDDGHYDDYDSHDPLTVPSPYGPGAGVTPIGYPDYGCRIDVELMPSGGYGTTTAWCEFGTEFNTTGNSSGVAQFHAECEWEGYTFGTANNTGGTDIEFRIYDLEHNSYESQNIESYEVGNYDIGTWVDGHKTVSLTHVLQPNRTYRAVFHVDSSIAVRGSGSTLDFGQPEYIRGGRPGLWPLGLEIEF